MEIPLENSKWSFASLDDALDFFEKTCFPPCPFSTHIVKARCPHPKAVGFEELFYVNVLSDEDKDSETHYLIELAYSYPSFVSFGLVD